MEMDSVASRQTQTATSSVNATASRWWRHVRDGGLLPSAGATPGTHLLLWVQTTTNHYPYLQRRSSDCTMISQFKSPHAA